MNHVLFATRSPGGHTFRMTEPPREDPPVRDPIDLFYDQVKAIFVRCGPGIFGKLETYGANRPMPVRLRKSTVRGWVNDRKALPDSGQFAAMMDFFEASRAIENGDSERLRKLWADACRRKDELRSLLKASSEETAEPEEPPSSHETGEPPRADKPSGDATPITLQAQAHPHADAGSRRRRMVTWISVGVGLGAALPSLALAFGAPHFSAAHRNTSATSTPRAQKPTKGTSLSPRPVAAPAHRWWCTNVIVERAGVYTEPRTDSAVLKYKARRDGIRVDMAFDGPAGWYVVWTPSGEYWMQSRALGAMTPSPNGCPDK